MTPTAGPQDGRRYGAKTAAERSEERRSRLLAAALDAFGTTGYRGVTIEALCAAARISTRNFYELFDGRESLLLALHDDLNARALQAVAEAVAACDPDDLAARALAGTRAYFAVVTTDHRWARIALVESVGVSPRAEQHRQAAIARFAALLEAETSRLAAAGLLPARDFQLTAVALVGAVNGLVGTWTADPGLWDARVDEVAVTAAELIVAAAGRPLAP